MTLNESFAVAVTGSGEFRAVAISGLPAIKRRKSRRAGKVRLMIGDHAEIPESGIGI
jgi:hypothetical protein